MDPEGAALGELNPPTVNPITELLKVPSILIVLLDTFEQVPIKLRKLLQLSTPTVKYVSIESKR